jgi:hypothetical protein
MIAILKVLWIKSLLGIIDTQLYRPEFWPFATIGYIHVSFLSGTFIPTYMYVHRYIKSLQSLGLLCLEVSSRVTRLSEYSPLGQLLTLGSYFENNRSSPKIGATFFHSNSYILFSTKYGLGSIMGGFFHKLIWSPWCLEVWSCFFCTQQFREVGDRTLTSYYFLKGCSGWGFYF